MAEDLSYLRARLDEACNGIARLEEQNKTLFHLVAKHETAQDEHRDTHAKITVDVAGLTARVGAVEEVKKGVWDKAWQVVMLVAGALTAGWIGAKFGSK